MIDLKFEPYIAPKVPVYSNDGTLLGVLTCYDDVTGLQIQLLEKKLTDQVYLLWENTKITFNHNAELSEWPKGMYDETQVRFAKMFNIRKAAR